jgi:septal ring factor EnvC (AmiA/AmiB activator)
MLYHVHDVLLCCCCYSGINDRYEQQSRQLAETDTNIFQLRRSDDEHKRNHITNQSTIAELKTKVNELQLQLQHDGTPIASHRHRHHYCVALLLLYHMARVVWYYR